ncbi:hypothetical protein NQD34_006081, partial [Periophthalmus magnuspinnatus]
EIKSQNGQNQEEEPKARKRKQFNKWSEEGMEAAINQYRQELESGKHPRLRFLAKTWNVPRSTLQRRVKGVVCGSQHAAAGRKAFLPPEAEKDLANTLISLLEQGVPLRPSNVRAVAFQYAKINGIQGFSETKERAGFYWFKGFLKRNPNLRFKMSKSLSNVNGNSLLETTEMREKRTTTEEAEDIESRNVQSQARKRKQLNTWSEESMEAAIHQYQQELESGKQPRVRPLAKMWNVPRTTLQRRVKEMVNGFHQMFFSDVSDDNNSFSLETTEMLDDETTEVTEEIESQYEQDQDEQPKAMTSKQFNNWSEDNYLTEKTFKVHKGIESETGQCQEDQAKARKRKQLNTWNEENMEAAISQYQQDVDSGRQPRLRPLAKIFNVPRTTLQRRVKEVVSRFHCTTKRTALQHHDTEKDDYKNFLEVHEEIESENGQGVAEEIESEDQDEQLKARKWSEKRMEAAINQYQQELQFGKKAKVRLLARTWKVPRSTLQRRVKGGVRRVCHNTERKALFPPEAEKDLANSLVSLSKQGLSLTPTVVRTMAYKYAKANGISGFSEAKEKAGYYWFKGFMKRNPEVSLKMSQELSHISSSPLAMTEKVEPNPTDTVTEEIEGQNEQEQDEQPKARKGKQFNKWSEEGMESAINQYQLELESGINPHVRRLARIWKVPRSTLQRRLKGGVRGSRLAAGRKALLTPEAEKDLLNSLTSLSEQGVSLTPTVVRTMAFQYAKANGISGFSETKGKAGFYWFKGFSKRNPNVCLNMSGDLSDVNSDCSLETETKEVIGQEITEVPEEIQSQNEKDQDEQPKERKRKQFNKWNEERMEAAINQYQLELYSGKSPKVRLLAKMWNVPRSTLQRRVKGVFSGFHAAAGGKALLSPEAEKDLVNTPVLLSGQGFPLKPTNIQTLAFQYAKVNGIPEFSEEKEKAGLYWSTNFMKQNSDVCTEMSGGISKCNDLQNYEALLTTLGITDIPSHIWCCDEINLQDNFSCEETPEKATILAGFNAAGTFTPTVVVLKEQTLDKVWFYGLDNNVLARVSEDGLINAKVLSEWGQVFVSNLPKDDKFPHLLLVNGPCSQLFSADLLNYLNEHSVYVMTSPVQTSQQSQAVHQVLFRSLQENWSKANQEWSRDTFGMTMSSIFFFSLFLEAWRKSSTVENAQAGFRDSGMYPV